MHRGRPHKPLEAGVIPAPATNFREVIRLPDCKSGVAKQSWKRRTGALPAFPMKTSPRCALCTSGQTARSVAANALGLGPRERRCKSCRADHFQLLSRITVDRPPVKRDGAGVNPAWGANLHAPVAQNTERRRPKARVVGESPAWSATEAEPAEAPGRS